MVACRVNAQQYLLVENFEGRASQPATAPGWTLVNNSLPKGKTWFYGRPEVFTAFTGKDSSYCAANFNSTGSTGDISNWLLTPEISLHNGNVFRFFTRAPTGTQFADRLQVYLSTDGAGTDVGDTSTSVGTFSTLLLDINPSLANTGYPAAWTGYSFTISGIAGSPTGRIGFRYYVTNGGPAGANSNFIGIDSVTYFGIGQVVNRLDRSAKAIEAVFFPNPCHDRLVVRGAEGEAELYDSSGRLVHKLSFVEGFAIDVSRLNNGVYYLYPKYKRGSGPESYKLIKE